MSAKAVSREQWLEARRALLADEKAFQKERDKLAEKRRALPWVKVDKDYTFDSEDGPVSLSDLFGGSSQLIVQHFMFHPDWDEGCKSCSFWADNFDRVATHLKARDAAFAAISRAPLDKLVAYKERLGWAMPWVSSHGNNFNHDFNVSFTPDELEAGECTYNYHQTKQVGPEMPGFSVFCRTPQGEIYHTYSCFSRGLDPFNPVYQFLDIAPKGRDEDSLAFTMEWLRRNDEY
ncbi:MAG: DUF899 domain-containing protein [Hyphomicrobiales bacterium]